MRASILYVLGAYPLWSETFIRQDLTLLLRLGVPLKPVALFPGDIERHPEWPEVPYLQRAENSPAERQKQREAPAIALVRRWIPSYLHTRLSLVRHRRLRRALSNLVAEHGIQHIHAEFADLPALLAASVARSRRISYSLGVHARDVHLHSFHPGFLFGRASFITSCNTMALNAVLEACPRVLPRAHLIYHGLELEEWPYRFEQRAAGEPLRLVFVGRFVAKKGIGDLLQALSLLRERGNDSQLTVIGSGPLEADLLACARELGLGDAVTWQGVLPRESVRDTMVDADALVVPSLIAPNGDRDGIPNVVLEAMALGTPVIGTQVGSLPEVLTERTGWIAEPENPESLAATITEFQHRPDEAETRRREARTRIEEDFSAEKLALERAGLFDKLNLASE
jgi:glycosyltransferase involved in cell wall biosynthesis